VLQLAANIFRTPQALAQGKIVGGRFVHPEQDLIEHCKFVELRAGGHPVFRICDVEASNDGESPLRTICTRLCVFGSRGGVDAREHLLLATAWYPPMFVAANKPLNESELNPNNFWSWVELGNVHAQDLRMDEAFKSWRQAACRWPRGVKHIACRMAHEFAKVVEIPDIESQRAVTFWQSLSNEQIAFFAREQNFQLGPEALA